MKKSCIAFSFEDIGVLNYGGGGGGDHLRPSNGSFYCERDRVWSPLNRKAQKRNGAEEEEEEEEEGYDDESYCFDRSL